MIISLNGENVDATPKQIEEFERISILASTPTVEDYKREIESHINTVATSREYASADRLMNYINSDVQLWADEARAFITWFNSVQLYAIEQLGLVGSGQREQPTIAEFIAELPVIDWPAASEL